jgi:hypothetical protein
MTTILTEIGWEDENGNPLGTWTNRADLVARGDEITVATGVVANTLGGDDSIFGSGGGLTGIDNSGAIITGDGRDTISGSAFGVEGIFNSGTISTGNGNDTISGSSVRGERKKVWGKREIS